MNEGKMMNMNLSLVIEKLRADLAAHAPGDLVVYKNDDLAKTVDAPLTASDAAILRNAVLFQGLPVVPEQIDDRRAALGYRVLTPKEYTHYVFTERNFRALPEQAVDAVMNAGGVGDHALGTGTRLALLICAETAYRQRTDKLRPLRLAELAQSTATSVNEVNTMLQALVNIGVLKRCTKKGKTLYKRMYDSRFRKGPGPSPGPDTKPAEAAAPDPAPECRRPAEAANVLAPFTPTQTPPTKPAAPAEQPEAEQSALDQTVRDIVGEYARRVTAPMEAQIAELRAQLEDALEQMEVLKNERTVFKKQADSALATIRTLRADQQIQQRFRRQLPTRMETITNHLTELIFDAVNKFDGNRNRGWFINTVNMAMVDTTRSLNALAGSAPKGTVDEQTAKAE